MRSLSIRSRLTLWYFCAFATAGLLLSLASWFLLQRSLDSLTMHELDERVDDLEEFLTTRAPGTSPEALRSEMLSEYRWKDEGKWLEVVDESNRWLYFSSRAKVADYLPSPPALHSGLVAILPMPGHSLRTLQREIDTDGHRYFVAMGISADNQVLILEKFGRNLWLMVPVVLLSAGLVGHLLSRKALNPVDAIVEEVRRINEQNLQIRLPVPPTKDELSRLSETLNQMLERIEIAFRSVRSLTANSSHELRTPLSLIRTRVEIALCFPRSAEQYRTVLEEVQEESVRMTALIENLLTLARYDAGAVQPQLQPIEINALASKAAKEWIPTAERSSTQFTVTSGPSPAWIMGNPESLGRLLRMLLDNAFRYTPAGGKINLNLQTKDGRILLAIRDSGIGISADDLPHIFERFYRARTLRSSEQFGSGLGLSLAKWIVEQHKGSITVESTPGVGCCFTVTLLEYKSAGAHSVRNSVASEP